MSDRKIKCIALYSGGLDSILAILMMLEQNIEVFALSYKTDFGGDVSKSSSLIESPGNLAERFGFKIESIYLGDPFIEMVMNPKHGYGKNMNPCIDCRILMLQKAKEYMQSIGADFVVTGEVIGQRPKSQMRNTLRLVEKESGLEGYLLRPLCAKLMEPTVPEKQDWVNRDLLKDFNGRSRKPQMILAEKYGLTDYPSPAGGCLLTDRGYSKRLKDLLDNQGDVDLKDLSLLRVGRHFRINDKVKMIIGRNEAENDKIESYKKDDDCLFEVKSAGSPITIIKGELNDELIEFACKATARYSDLKREPEVEVTYWCDDIEKSIVVHPFGPDELKEYQL